MCINSTSTVILQGSSRKILLDDSYNAKIFDFGLAKLLTSFHAQSVVFYDDDDAEDAEFKQGRPDAVMENDLEALDISRS
ncbi:hypothetical protein L1987_00596 [Smallanthus sonchifolius]|uniref:Uncharacterized protein n=1 Tax=Smallanthus sonchifolius TaxID=185202 RepID=A0ACB9K2S5_9ASTR|nr:hypothetical protein L1987_00596 [Smallanthus sonchifolius]